MNNQRSNRDGLRELISGYLDGELTQQDRQRLEVAMDQDEQLRKEFDDMKKIKSSVGVLQYETPPGEEIERIMGDVAAKTSSGFGWILFVLGTVLLTGFAIYEFSIDNTVPALIRIGVAALIIGTILLFIGVLRQRHIAAKTDKYKGVKI